MGAPQSYKEKHPTPLGSLSTVGWIEGASIYDGAIPMGTIRRVVIEGETGMVLGAEIVSGGFLGIGAFSRNVSWLDLSYDVSLRSHQLAGPASDGRPDEAKGHHSASKQIEVRDLREISPFWSTGF
jgi:hypothetical protein